MREGIAACVAPVSYRQTLEELLNHELQMIRLHAIHLSDNNSDTVVDWWAQYSTKMPLLNVFGRIAIVTPIVTLEVEREFSCQGELTIF